MGEITMEAKKRYGVSIAISISIENDVSEHEVIMSYKKCREHVRSGPIQPNFLASFFRHSY